MKGKAAVLIFVVPVMAVIVLAIWRGPPVPNGKAPATNVLPSVAVTRTATPQRRDFAETCRWFGKVESGNKTRIIALEPGRIVSIAAGDGMPVKEGEPLLALGGPLIDSRLDALDNQIATLSERVRLAEQTMKIKQEAVAQQFVRQDELASAEDALALLKSEMVSVQQQRWRWQEATNLRAVGDGVFTNRQVSVGQEVQKGDYLADIMSADHLYIAATLFSSGKVELVGKRTTIDLAGGASLSGTITRAMPQKTSAGADIVWIMGGDLATALSPGQAVTGTLVLSVHEKALSVPQNAIVRDQEERAYVMLKTSSGFRVRTVRTGLTADGLVEIPAGLKEGDEVVIRGAYELFNRDFNKIYKVAD